MSQQRLLIAILLVCLLLAGLLLSGPAGARGIYETPRDFLARVFDGDVPKPAVIWLTGEVKRASQAILQHKPGRLRVRYWAKGDRSAWILEEIGKTKPITVGIVIRSGAIDAIRVLEFRESRGDEVRHDFFTDQFRQARLQPDHRLDTPIDGITGATLSVQALTRLARLALYLDQQRPAHDAP